MDPMHDQAYWMMYAGYLLLVLVCLVVSKAAYRNGVHDGWRAHRDPKDPLWNKQRLICRARGEDVVETKCPHEHVRGPGDEECEMYRPGEAVDSAKCETDGHYLCAGCKFNIHRLPDRLCRNGERGPLCPDGG